MVYSPAMAQTDALTRVRQRIRRLLEDSSSTQRELARWLGHGDQWASNLLAGRQSLSLGDLDRVAAFFGVPPGEIVRVADEPWELSPTEMRLVRASRMLPPTVRDHLVTLADYLIGVVPDEIERLTMMREMDPDDLRVVDQWIEMKRFEKARGLATPRHVDLAMAATPQAASTPRTRGTRRGKAQEPAPKRRGA